jgi:hypothetical protein
MARSSFNRPSACAALMKRPASVSCSSRVTRYSRTSSVSYLEHWRAGWRFIALSVFVMSLWVSADNIARVAQERTAVERFLR